MRHFLVAVLIMISFIFFLKPSALALPESTGSDGFENTFSLSHALNHAYAHNPRIKALMARWDARIEQYRDKTGLPDPMINVTYFPSPIETRLGPQDYNFTISQGVPFPGKLSKKGTIVEKDILVSKLKLDRELKEIHAQIVKSYAELSYIQRAKDITAQNMELIDVLMVQAEQTYAQDKGVLMDVMRARSQKGQVQYDLILLEEIEKTQKADLNALMSRLPDAPIGSTRTLDIKPVVYVENEIIALALENNESIQIAQAMVDKASAGLDLAETAKLPDFKIGVFYAGIGDAPANIEDSGKDAVGVQFGMTIPLWNQKNKGRELSALYEKRAVQADKKSVENQISAQISKIFFKLKNARRLITLYNKDLLPQAVNTMQTSELWFRENQTAFSDYLETQTLVLRFQLALIRAKADYVKFFADLEKLAGIPLHYKVRPSSVSK